MTQPAVTAIGTRAQPREQWAWPWSTIVLRQQAARIAELERQYDLAKITIELQKARIATLETENEELRADRQKVIDDFAGLSQAYNERGDRCEELMAALREQRTSLALAGKGLCFCERKRECREREWPHFPECLMARKALGVEED